MTNQDASEDSPSPRDPLSADPTDALERELYWAAPPGAGSAQAVFASTPASELAVSWKELEDRLRFEYTQVYPPGEEVMEIGGGVKRRVKRAIFRVIRPVIRRYDRLGADTAKIGFETAQSIAGTQRELAGLLEQLQALTGEVRGLRADVRAGQTAAHEHDVRIGEAATELELLARQIRARQIRAGGGAVSDDGDAAPARSLAPDTEQLDLPQAFYWRFEAALRGSAESVMRKLERYEGLATGLHDRFEGDPLWLDLGCGEGQFMSLLRSWGWRVLGMDVSTQAVEAVGTAGLEAVVGSLPGFLADYEGEAPAGISMIQVIEHLPAATWLPTLRYAHRILASDGALVIETIDPRNPHALQWFFGDVTHTWPAHPETLRVMAEYAGFDETEIIGMNPDEQGTPQDFALVARKA